MKASPVVYNMKAQVAGVQPGRTPKTPVKSVHFHPSVMASASTDLAPKSPKSPGWRMRRLSPMKQQAGPRVPTPRQPQAKKDTVCVVDCNTLQVVQDRNKGGPEVNIRTTRSTPRKAREVENYKADLISQACMVDLESSRNNMADSFTSGFSVFNRSLLTFSPTKNKSLAGLLQPKKDTSSKEGKADVLRKTLKRAIDKNKYKVNKYQKTELKKINLNSLVNSTYHPSLKNKDNSERSQYPVQDEKLVHQTADEESEIESFSRNGLQNKIRSGSSEKLNTVNALPEKECATFSGAMAKTPERCRENQKNDTLSQSVSMQSARKRCNSSDSLQKVDLVDVYSQDAGTLKNRNQSSSSIKNKNDKLQCQESATDAECATVSKPKTRGRKLEVKGQSKDIIGKRTRSKSVDCEKGNTPVSPSPDMKHADKIVKSAESCVSYDHKCDTSGGPGSSLLSPLPAVKRPGRKSEKNIQSCVSDHKHNSLDGIGKISASSEVFGDTDTTQTVQGKTGSSIQVGTADVIDGILQVEKADSQQYHEIQVSSVDHIDNFHSRTRDKKEKELLDDSVMDEGRSRCVKQKEIQDSSSIDDLDKGRTERGKGKELYGDVIDKLDEQRLDCRKGKGLVGLSVNRKKSANMGSGTEEARVCTIECVDMVEEHRTGNTVGKESVGVTVNRKRSSNGTEVTLVGTNECVDRVKEYRTGNRKEKECLGAAVSRRRSRTETLVRANECVEDARERTERRQEKESVGVANSKTFSTGFGETQTNRSDLHTLKKQKKGKAYSDVSEVVNQSRSADVTEEEMDIVSDLDVSGSSTGSIQDTPRTKHNLAQLKVILEDKRKKGRSRKANNSGGKCKTLSFTVTNKEFSPKKEKEKIKSPSRKVKESESSGNSEKSPCLPEISIDDEVFLKTDLDVTQTPDISAVRGISSTDNEQRKDLSTECRSHKIPFLKDVVCNKAPHNKRFAEYYSVLANALGLKIPIVVMDKLEHVNEHLQKENRTEKNGVSFESSATEQKNVVSKSSASPKKSCKTSKFRSSVVSGSKCRELQRNKRDLETNSDTLVAECDRTTHLSEHDTGNRSTHQSELDTGDKTTHLSEHATGNRTTHQSEHDTGDRTTHLSEHDTGNRTTHQPVHDTCDRTTHLSEHDTGNRTTHQPEHNTGDRTTHPSKHDTGDGITHSSEHVMGDGTCGLSHGSNNRMLGEKNVMGSGVNDISEKSTSKKGEQCDRIKEDIRNGCTSCMVSPTEEEHLTTLEANDSSYLSVVSKGNNSNSSGDDVWSVGDQFPDADGENITEDFLHSLLSISCAGKSSTSPKSAILGNTVEVDFYPGNATEPGGDDLLTLLCLQNGKTVASVTVESASESGMSEVNVGATENGHQLDVEKEKGHQVGAQTGRGHFETFVQGHEHGEEVISQNTSKSDSVHFNFETANVSQTADDACSCSDSELADSVDAKKGKMYMCHMCGQALRSDVSLTAHMEQYHSASDKSDAGLTLVPEHQSAESNCSVMTGAGERDNINPEYLTVVAKSKEIRNGTVQNDSLVKSLEEKEIGRKIGQKTKKKRDEYNYPKSSQNCGKSVSQPDSDSLTYKVCELPAKLNDLVKTRPSGTNSREGSNRSSKQTFTSTTEVEVVSDISSDEENFRCECGNSYLKEKTLRLHQTTCKVYKSAQPAGAEKLGQQAQKNRTKRKHGDEFILESDVNRRKDESPGVTPSKKHKKIEWSHVAKKTHGKVDPTEETCVENVEVKKNHCSTSEVSQSGVLRQCLERRDFVDQEIAEKDVSLALSVSCDSMKEIRELKNGSRKGRKGKREKGARKKEVSPTDMDVVLDEVSDNFYPGGSECGFGEEEPFEETAGILPVVEKKGHMQKSTDDSVPVMVKNRSNKFVPVLDQSFVSTISTDWDGRLVIDESEGIEQRTPPPVVQADHKGLSDGSEPVQADDKGSSDGSEPVTKMNNSGQDVKMGKSDTAIELDNYEYAVTESENSNDTVNMCSLETGLNEEKSLDQGVDDSVDEKSNSAKNFTKSSNDIEKEIKNSKKRPVEKNNAQERSSGEKYSGLTLFEMEISKTPSRKKKQKKDLREKKRNSVDDNGTFSWVKNKNVEDSKQVTKVKEGTVKSLPQFGTEGRMMLTNQMEIEKPYAKSNIVKNILRQQQAKQEEVNADDIFPPVMHELPPSVTNDSIYRMSSSRLGEKSSVNGRTCQGMSGKASNSTDESGPTTTNSLRKQSARGETSLISKSPSHCGKPLPSLIVKNQLLNKIKECGALNRIQIRGTNLSSVWNTSKDLSSIDSSENRKQSPRKRLSVEKQKSVVLPQKRLGSLLFHKSLDSDDLENTPNSLCHLPSTAILTSTPNMGRNLLPFPEGDQNNLTFDLSNTSTLMYDGTEEPHYKSTGFSLESLEKTPENISAECSQMDLEGLQTSESGIKTCGTLNSGRTLTSNQLYQSSQAPLIGLTGRFARDLDSPRLRTSEFHLVNEEKRRVGEKNSEGNLERKLFGDSVSEQDVFSVQRNRSTGSSVGDDVDSLMSYDRKLMADNGVSSSNEQTEGDENVVDRSEHSAFSGSTSSHLNMTNKKPNSTNRLMEVESCFSLDYEEELQEEETGPSHNFLGYDDIESICSPEQEFDMDPADLQSLCNPDDDRNIDTDSVDGGKNAGSLRRDEITDTGSIHGHGNTGSMQGDEMEQEITLHAAGSIDDDIAEAGPVNVKMDDNPVELLAHEAESIPEDEIEDGELNSLTEDYPLSHVKDKISPFDCSPVSSPDLSLDPISSPCSSSVVKEGREEEDSGSEKCDEEDGGSEKDGDDSDALSLYASSEASFLGSVLETSSVVKKCSSSLRIDGKIMEEEKNEEKGKMKEKNVHGWEITDSVMGEADMDLSEVNSVVADQDGVVQTNNGAAKQSILKILFPGFCFSYLNTGACKKSGNCPYQHEHVDKDIAVSRGLEEIKRCCQTQEPGRALEIYTWLCSNGFRPLPVHLPRIMFLYHLMVRHGLVVEAFKFLDVIHSLNGLTTELCENFIRLCGHSYTCYAPQLYEVFRVLQQRKVAPSSDCMITLLRCFSALKKWRQLFEVMLFCSRIPGFSVPKTVMSTILEAMTEQELAPKLWPMLECWLLKCPPPNLEKLELEELGSLADTCSKFKNHDLVRGLQHVAEVKSTEQAAQVVSPVDTSYVDAPPAFTAEEVAVRQDDIMNCKYSRDWNYLSGLFVKLSLDNPSMNAALIDVYTRCLKNLQQPEIMVQAFQLFIDKVMEYCKDGDSKQPGVDKLSLARIGNSLVMACYKEQLCWEGYDILYKLHEHSINYLRLAGPHQCDIAHIAMEFCAAVQQPQGALMVLQGLRTDADSRTMATLIPQMTSLFHLTMQNCEFTSAHQFLMAVSEQVQLDTDLDLAHKIDLPGLFYKLIINSLAFDDVMIAKKTYLFHKDSGLPFQLPPFALRALLTACWEEGHVEVANELYQLCKHRNLYPEQSVLQPRCIRVLVSNTPAEMYLIIMDYLTTLYNYLCDRMLEGMMPKLNDLVLCICIEPGIGDALAQNLPYLSFAPRTQSDAQKLILDILETKFAPPMKGMVNEVDGTVQIASTPLQNYLIGLDKIGRRQHLIFGSRVGRGTRGARRRKLLDYT